jgi:hypothetical protein
MKECHEEIDEVALNVLIAEGLDVATAVEASRCDSSTEPSALHCHVQLILLVVAIVLIVAYAF